MTTIKQQQSIQNYHRLGLEIEILEEGEVKVAQKRLLNGQILNQKQLHDRAREIFPDSHIIPVVYSLNVDGINMEWIKSKMKEFGIKKNDLIKQLAIDKSSLSLYFSGKKKMAQSQKAAFFYYFITYELNRDFRENG